MTKFHTRDSYGNLKHIGGLREKVLEWMQDYLKDREMRTVIREATSSWRNVTSGVLQIYLNDTQTSYMNPFADDAKLMRVVEITDDC